MTQASRVLAALQEQYPSKVLPLGGAKALAERLGVAPSTVTRTMKANDFHCLFQHRLNRCRKCMYCGERVVWGNLCHAHYFVPISCVGCDTIFYLTPSKAIERLRRSTKTGLFCGRRCQGQWLGKTHGFGRTS